jgi:hypothetical protein
MRYQYNPSEEDKPAEALSNWAMGILLEHRVCSLGSRRIDMTRVNTNGDEIEETKMFQMWCGEHTDEERDMAISLLLDHFNLEIVMTNATKHGTTEMVLRKQEIPNENR